MHWAYDAKQGQHALRWVAIVCLIASPQPAAALGFGALQLQSSLGEPLAARIELVSVQPAERESLTVRIGGKQAYRRFGLRRSSAIAMIEVDIAEVRARRNTVVLQLSSLAPINAPLLELLVVAETARGRTMRQYAILLDPAGGVTDADVFGPVEFGQTLWEIARALKYPEVSRYQMLAALYQANPDAFAGSVARLRAGATLAVPTVETVRAVDPAQARTLVAKARSERRRQAIVASRGHNTAANAARLADRGAQRSAAVRSPRAAGGRLRLVVPRNAAFTRGSPAPTAGAARGQRTPAGDALIGPRFGMLSMPASFDARAGNSRTEEAGRGRPTNKGQAFAVAFGRLAAAPAAFPTTTPASPYNAGGGGSVDGSTAGGKAGVQNPDRPLRHAPSWPASMARPAAAFVAGLSIRAILWVTAIVFVLIAAGLWLQARRGQSVAVAGLNAPGNEGGNKDGDNGGDVGNDECSREPGAEA